MGTNVRESIEELRALAQEIGQKSSGWKSVFRRKKELYLQFMDKACDVLTALEQAQQADKAQIEEVIQDRTDDMTERLLRHEQGAQRQAGAFARQLMETKWRQIDDAIRTGESGKDILTCKICGHEAERQEYEKLESDCRFYGGKLTRYICPACGVIFGPTKFSELSKEEIDDDYIVHYAGFHEGDSTEKELNAFYLLAPTKQGIYLNYGCGSWSSSLERLREKGYQVFGYEPYAPKTDNPYLITEAQELMKMRFDGIYSNDLLEHLLEPAESLRFMRDLLKSPLSKMAHSTSCYVYKYEYTRFHTFFYTGDSLKVLCEKTGLEIVNKIDRLTEDDFICCVFQPAAAMDYTRFLLGLSEGESRILSPGQVMYGPYLTLSGSACFFVLDITYDERKVEHLECRLTERAGKKVLCVITLHSGSNEIKLDHNRVMTDLEFVIENNTDSEITINKLEMRAGAAAGVNG